MTALVSEQSNAPKRLYALIEKVEPQADGTVRAYGIASSEDVDDQGETVRASAMRAAIPEYLRFPAIREMHGLSAAGTALEIEVGDDNITRLVAHVVDPVAVLKVKNQVYRAFSIGGRVTEREAGNPKTITGLLLNEVSLVDRPSNGAAVLEFWKSSDLNETLPENEMTDSAAVAAAAAATPETAIAAALSEAEAKKTAAVAAAAPTGPVQVWTCGFADHRHVAKADALKCAEKQAAAAPEPAESEEAVAKATDIPEAETAPVAAPDGAPEAEAAEAELTPEEIEKRAEAGASEAQAAIDAALAAIEKGSAALAEPEPVAETPKTPAASENSAAEKSAETPAAADVPPAEVEVAKADDAKGDYGDVKYADPGYQSDGKKRYPIDTEDHIRAAWSYINKPKNAGKYTSTQLSHIKSEIVTEWKAKIDKDGPPSAAKAGESGNIAKSLYDVGDIAQLIMWLDNLQERFAYESAIEGDNSALPAKAGACCAQLCALLRDLVAEETAEIMAGTEMDDDGDGDGDMDMDVVAMSAVARELRKLGKDELATRLEKAGAKNSAHDQALLDMAYGCTDKCMKTDGCTKAMTDHLGKCMGELKAAGAQAYDEDSADGQKAVVALDLAKKHGGHQALMDAAHDCLGKMASGAMCGAAAKAGARHSASKMSHIQKAHDHLCEAGANCDGMNKDDDMAMAAKAAAAVAGAAKEEDVSEKEIAKRRIAAEVADLHGEVVWKVEQIQPTPGAEVNEALAKAVATNAELVKTVSVMAPMLERLAKRVDDIANTPLPPMTMAKGTIVVSKDGDGGGVGPDIDEVALAAEMDKFIKMSKEEQDLKRVELAQKNPMVLTPSGFQSARGW